jgi:hypothetical protein
MLAWTRSSPTHICDWALAARAVVPASAAYPAATRYAVREAGVIAVPAATEPAESGVGLGVGPGLPVGVEEVPEDVDEPPDPVLGDVLGAVLGAVGGVVGFGGVDDPPVPGGGEDEPAPGPFAGGLDECCGGVGRAGRFSSLHCRSVAG